MQEKFLSIGMAVVCLLGLATIVRAAGFQVYEFTYGDGHLSTSGFYSSSYATAADDAGESDDNDIHWNPQDVDSIIAVCAPNGCWTSAQGRGGASYQIDQITLRNTVYNTVDLNEYGRASGVIDPMGDGFHASASGEGWTVHPRVTNGIFFQIVPETGEQWGDPVTISYKVDFNATNACAPWDESRWSMGYGLVGCPGGLK